MEQLAVTGPSTSSAPGAVRLTDLFWPVAAALLAIRVYFDSLLNLVPDEAFYWTWTRHLSTGYFDHPPMIAWLIWLSTRVMGNTELGVRFPAALLSIATLAVLYGLARRLFPTDPRAVGYVLLMWICGPLLQVIGTIITPDAPAIFFSLCAMGAAALAVSEDRPSDRPRKAALLWIGFGVCSGLAMLSKYTTVLVPAAVGLSLLFSPSGRRRLAQPWIYVAAVMALLIFSPNILWNRDHDWASYRFQLLHGAGGALTEGKHGLAALAARLMGLGEFVGGQALVWTPVLFIVAIGIVVINLLEYRRLPLVDQMLLWCGLLPLVFFGWAATRSHGEINWPAFAYFPLSLLIGRYLGKNWGGRRVQWVGQGCKVAICFSLAIHLVALPRVQQWILRRGIHLTHQVTDLWGWPDFGRQLAQSAAGDVVAASRHQDAGEASFYMPGQPDVWCPQGVGGRPTAFDYYPGAPDFATIPRVLFVGGNVDVFMKKYKYPIKLEIIDVQRIGVSRSRSTIATLVAKQPPVDR